MNGDFYSDHSRINWETQPSVRSNSGITCLFPRHGKTSLNRPTMAPTSKGDGRFREVVGLVFIVRKIVWDPNKAIDIGEWSICGGGRLERFPELVLFVWINN